MKRLTIALTVAGVLVAAGRAHACSGGGGNNYAAIYIGVYGGIAAAGAIDLSFTIHDAVVDRSSIGASTAEVLLTAPQAVFGVWVASQMHDAKNTGIVLLLAAWPAALTAHGIYSLATHEEPYDPGPTSRSIHLAPTAVSDGTNLAPGLLAVGRF